MRNTLLITLLLAVNTFLYSQDQITGTITDAETGEPIFSANVYFPKLEKGSMTDVDGKFSISNLPAGNYKIVISSIGYATLNQEITLPAGNIQFRSGFPISYLFAP